MTNDNQKWIVSALVIFGILIWIVVESLAVFIIGAFKLRNPELFDVVAVSQLIALAVALPTTVVLIRHKLAGNFLSEVVVELKKVVWPGQKETIASTVIVVVTVLIFAVILGVYDAVWSKLIQWMIA